MVRSSGWKLASDDSRRSHRLSEYAMNIIRFLLLLCLSAPAWAQTANLWIDANGGTCTRQSTPAAYNDAAACASMQDAAAAASNGDAVLIKQGTGYGDQTVTAAKGSPGVTIKCETATVGACVFTSISVSGSWLTIQDVTADVGDSCIGCSPVGIGGSNLLMKNVVMLGAFQSSSWTGYSDVVWDGGSLWSASRPSGVYVCTLLRALPITIFAGTNMTIRNVTFWPMLVDGATQCGGDPIHAERLRIDGDVTNLLIERSTFKTGGQENTAMIFLTDSTGQNMSVKFRNNFLGGDVLFGGGNQGARNTSGSCTGTMQYNSITGLFIYNGCSSAGITLVGNAGPYQSFAPCVAGNHVKNIWQWDQATGCGSDTWVNGAQYSTSALGFDANSGVVSSGSAAVVNAGEATCAVTANGQDIRGYARGSNGACDAGSFEYGASGGGSVPSAPSNFRTVLRMIEQLIVSTLSSIYARYA